MIFFSLVLTACTGFGEPRSVFNIVMLHPVSSLLFGLIPQSSSYQYWNKKFPFLISNVWSKFVYVISMLSWKR